MILLKKIKKKKIGIAVVNIYNNPLNQFYIYFFIIYFYLKFLFTKNSINFDHRKKNIPYNFKLYHFLQSKNTLQVFFNIKKILQTTSKLKKIIFTFEGHAFEKLLTNYCNKKKIFTIGYYFTVIRSFNSSIFYDFGNSTLPKKIWATGKNVKRHLLDQYNKNKIDMKISVIGYSRDIEKNKYKKNSNCNILFCPEGFYEETEKMFEFAKLLSKTNKNLNIVFRFHPEISKSFIKKLIDKKHNIIISKLSMSQDLMKANILIYRGSSVCINATYSNTLPVYLNLDDRLNLDPLFKINKFKVKNTEDFKRIFKFLNDKKKFNLYMKKIRNYADNYFEKINYKKIYKQLIKI